MCRTVALLSVNIFFLSESYSSAATSTPYAPLNIPAFFSIIAHSKIKTDFLNYVNTGVHSKKYFDFNFYVLSKLHNFHIYFLIEHVYSFTVRTINDAAESIRISDPSQAVSCKTKAMGKISILMKMLIELFFLSVLWKFLAMLRLFCHYQRISDINLTHKKSNCFK